LVNKGLGWVGALRKLFNHYKSTSFAAKSPDSPCTSLSLILWQIFPGEHPVLGSFVYSFGFIFTIKFHFISFVVAVGASSKSSNVCLTLHLSLIYSQAGQNAHLFVCWHRVGKHIFGIE
jgi:hypothetical protein